MGRFGRTLAPIQNNNIKLAYENLYLTSDVCSNNEVVLSECWYYLKNLKDTTQNIALGFICDDTIGCDATAELDDEKVHRQYILVESASIKKRSMGKFDYYAKWDLSFKSHELKKVHIKQSLLFSMGDAASENYLPCSSRSFYYILNLASLWAETPDSMDVSFDFGSKFDANNARWLANNSYSINPSGYQWLNDHVIQWHLCNAKPDSNLNIHIVHYNTNKDPLVLLTEEIGPRYCYTLSRYDGDKIIYGDSDLIYRKADIDTMEIRKMQMRFQDHISIQRLFVQFRRNLIYAVHGYVFKNKYWSDFFNSFSWYKPNPAFTDNDLNTTEKRNVLFIANHEKALGIKGNDGKE